ncbi:MAG: ABC transporter ATP-binding protein [Tepidanaerobacteraceae bacterium]|nr:ABC transporter ATP-binding protein [Tepidanaerobacteraceae bacterium]
MENPLLSVKDLSISFNTNEGKFNAVDGVSFDVNKGEIFALVGESGCGKSTTAFGLMRLIPKPGEISQGKIIFDGKNLVKLPEDEMPQIRGKEIGMIFQNPLDSLNPVYSVGKQIYEGLILDNIGKQDAWKRVVDIFNDVQISDPKERIESYPHELSGGMRQRVMIAMMLSRRPKLLIADEPTTALDVTIQAQILELIKELRDTFNTAVLIITHDFGVVAEIADKVGVMYAGKIVEVGDVYQIFENPLHPYTKLLMKALPRITKQEGRLETISGTVPNLVSPPKGCRFHPRCPMATDICAVEAPVFKEAEKNHRYCCHLEVKKRGTHH